LRCASIDDYIKYPRLSHSVPLWQAETEELALQSFATPQRPLTTPLPEARRAAIAKLGAQRFNAMATAVHPGIEFHNQYIGQYSPPDKKLVNKDAFVALCDTVTKLVESGENAQRIGSVLHGTLDRVGFGTFAYEHANHAFAQEEQPLKVISVFPPDRMGDELFEPKELDLENVDGLLSRGARRTLGLQSPIYLAIAAQIVLDVKDLGPHPSEKDYNPAFGISVNAIVEAVLRDPTVVRYNQDAREVFVAMFTTFPEARLPMYKPEDVRQNRRDFERNITRDQLTASQIAQRLAKYVAEKVQKVSHKEEKSQRQYLDSIRKKGQEIYIETVKILQTSDWYASRARAFVGDYLFLLFSSILNRLGEYDAVEDVLYKYRANQPALPPE
jgi:hypothetical protein